MKNWLIGAGVAFGLAFCAVAPALGGLVLLAALCVAISV